MRIYGPRVGKFLSEDPLTPKYPELTPYQFASNRPIDGVDLDGLEYLTANYLITTKGHKTTIKLLDYRWFNKEYHSVAGPKGAGVQYNIFILNANGSITQKQSFVARGAYTEYGNYYGSTPLLNMYGQGNFIPKSYNYELPAVGTVDALAKAHDMAYDAVGAASANSLFNDWGTTPADEAAAKGWMKFTDKYAAGDDDPLGGKVGTNSLESAKGGYMLFNKIVTHKKNEINNFMSNYYANAKHGSVFFWGKRHFSQSDRENNYQMFLKIYMEKGEDGYWHRNNPMWNDDGKGGYTPKKPIK